MIIPCECGAKLRIDDAKMGDRGARVRCPRCGNVLTATKPSPVPNVVPRPEAEISSPPAAGEATAPPETPSAAGKEAPLVLVAHDSDVVRDMVGGVLLDAGFRVEHAADGMEALAKANDQVPQAMILDVGIPGLYGFDLCERLKRNPATTGIKVILLASVYGITRYKRTPTSLYGADDYIEKHHITDSLVNKVNTLLLEDGQNTARTTTVPEEGPAAASAAPGPDLDTGLFSPASLVVTAREHAGMPIAARTFPAPSSSDTPIAATPPPTGAMSPSPHDGQTIVPESFSLEESIFEKEECDIPKVEEADPEAVEKAKRFARIIVSDIALYNQEAVVEGVKNGTFYELLKNDVEEGRRLYEARVPASLRRTRDYYSETMENFIAAQRKIVR